MTQVKNYRQISGDPIMTADLNSPQRGSTLIEVLVTFFILAVGLLGLLALHSRLQQSETESYQRSQALLLIDDMSSRLASNPNFAANYVTSNSGIGAGADCPLNAATTKDADIKAWCEALKGASETDGANKLGAMIGGRGCIESLGGDRYMITVAWQGLTPLTAPPASVACGKNLYNGVSGSACVNDLCRRTVTTVMEIANLSEP